MSHRETLEQRLLEAPDVATWSVYADLLQAQGDPQGELIASQIALDRTPRNTRLRARRDQLVAQITPGNLANNSFASLSPTSRLDVWAGYVVTAELLQSHDIGAMAVDKLARRLVQSGQCSRLRTLRMGASPMADYSPMSLPKAVAAVADSGPHDALEELSLELERSSARIGPIRPIVDAAPRLRRLEVRGVDIQIEPRMNHPTLEHLRIETVGLSAQSLMALAASKLPRLKRLDLFIGGPTGLRRNAREVAANHLRALLNSKGLPALEHLGLQNNIRAKDVVALLPTARLTPQLATLDLSMGALGDGGAKPLLTESHAFDHLTIDLSLNRLNRIRKKLEAHYGDRLYLGMQRVGERYHAMTTLR